MAQVAQGLAELSDSVVFVGGAIISVYVDDPAADEVRPTKDIDLAVDILSYGEWSQLVDRLRVLGFREDPHRHLSAFLYQDISVDILPANEAVLGVTNCWYKPALSMLMKERLPAGPSINLLSAPYFLATKFEAFHDRGQWDYRASHDFEDIIYVLDNRSTMIQEILESDMIVKRFLQDSFQHLLDQPYAEEYISGHLHPLIVEARLPLLMEKIRQILKI
ncbi:MAG: hypothetical protein KF690_09685 [Bacteroidetes bacterium]|nr:hypothetical protein [Bacteroidota bacterium]